MMLTLRSKTRYEAMRWQPTQEVYDEFLEWQPAPMTWKPGQDALQVNIEANAERQTDVFISPALPSPQGTCDHQAEGGRA